MDTIDISHSEEIFTVSRLNREVRFVLEGSFPTLWIEGEISNFSAPQSGHWYFSLKDALAQIRCAMFRPQNRKLDFIPKDGMHVIAKANVSLYEGRGDFQLLIETMEEAGEGRLRKEFELLKKRLSEKGLFESRHKKSIPTLPQRLGVITSPTGAAIQDILNVLKRRFTSLPIILYPTAVQGESAAPAIVKAIQLANQRQECDVLLLARGGGSLEDLWPFNAENVAFAIFESKIPIISGIGHEIDFTIADFVADLRAPTPSAAAELATPDTSELLQSITYYERQLIQSIKQKLQYIQQNMLWMTKHIQQLHPKRKLLEQSQRLDLSEAALVRLQLQRITQLKTLLTSLKTQLTQLTPALTIREINHHLHLQKRIFNESILNVLQHHQSTLSNAAAKLNALSPLATLERGFAIATLANKGEVLRNTADLRVDDKVKVRLLKGAMECKVEKIYE